jgi:hypothetical protein
MTAQSWFKFYPSDWRGDAKLQACSLAARGLWIDLICIMHEANPYGHLAINDKPMSYYRISQLVHADRKQVQRLMAHLKTRGVFGVTSRGILYSRRMVRDELKRQQKQGVNNYSELNQINKIAPPDTRKKEREKTKREKNPASSLASALPAGALARLPTRDQTKAQRAQQLWERDLLAKLGARGYANAIDMLAADPVLVDRATRAELRKPRSGVMAAMIGLREKIRREA